jgi:uncharacterized protein YkwD
MTIDSPATIQNQVGRGNRSDLYRFSLGDRSRLNLRFRSANPGASLSLIHDKNQNGKVDPGEQIRRHSSRTRRSEPVSVPVLEAGDYFLQVTAPRRAASSYRLQLVATAADTATPTNPGTPTTPPINDFATRVLDLTNAFRRDNGLAALRLSTKLNTVAQSHSRSMAVQDFFSHRGLDGSQAWDRMQAAGYNWTYAAENIAAGQQTPEAVVNAWINSPGHRANLLAPKAKEMGVGYFFLETDTGQVNYSHYWTQVLGAID